MFGKAHEAKIFTMQP